MNVPGHRDRCGRTSTRWPSWGLIALVVVSLLFSVHPGAATDEDPDLNTLLNQLGDKAKDYDLVALRFVAIESARSSDNPDKVSRYDYMYVEAEEQRYRPYRQKHT